MRPPVFLDTSAWLAALSVRESRHEEVAACYTELVRSARRLVTTNLVLSEMHALFLRRRGPEHALTLLDLARDDPTHELIVVDDELHDAAIDCWIRGFADQSFSLTDAVSFETMSRHEIEEALTLDQHFATAGFRLLPADAPQPSAARPKKRR